MAVTVKTLKIEGMSCSHCEKAVKTALSELKGVAKADVDLKAGTATVEYDSELVTDADFSEAIDDAGYTLV